MRHRPLTLAFKMLRFQMLRFQMRCSRTQASRQPEVELARRPKVTAVCTSEFVSPDSIETSGGQRTTRLRRLGFFFVANHRCAVLLDHVLVDDNFANRSLSGRLVHDVKQSRF